jgi:hypothetical protein
MQSSAGGMAAGQLPAGLVQPSNQSAAGAAMQQGPDISPLAEAADAHVNACSPAPVLGQMRACKTSLGALREQQQVQGAAWLSGEAKFSEQEVARFQAGLRQCLDGVLQIKVIRGELCRSFGSSLPADVASSKAARPTAWLCSCWWHSSHHDKSWWVDTAACMCADPAAPAGAATHPHHVHSSHHDVSSRLTLWHACVLLWLHPQGLLEMVSAKIAEWIAEFVEDVVRMNPALLPGNANPSSPALMRSPRPSPRLSGRSSFSNIKLEPVAHGAGAGDCTPTSCVA